MNCKLEKFWNKFSLAELIEFSCMNCKLEKFWNASFSIILETSMRWTVNLKSFEIKLQKTQKLLEK